MKTAVVAAPHDRREDAPSDAVARAVELLKQGEVVALPTETVYGLAADALRPEAVVKIFEVKERPRFNPLIIHLPDTSWLERVANVPTQDKELILRVTDRFWPGPFTIVLPKTDLVPDIVTAGLDTVAVRISAHPVLRDVLTKFGKPLAAPSANRFGRISPTTAQHVNDELGGRIPLIVDAGPATHGLESTVVAVRSGSIEILRPGPITREDLHRGIGGPPMGRRPSADAPERKFRPLNPNESISIRQGANLPHWSQEKATYAVAFRLVDSLPADVVSEWKRQRRGIVTNAKQQGRPLSDSERHRLTQLFADKVERFLDAGTGECWLRDERVARISCEALTYFEGQRYDLFAWCIMPNHVHAIVRPRDPFSLSQILQTWKSVIAHKANQVLGRQGPFWQSESYDHLIRDESDLRHQIRYVEKNPAKAGLRGRGWSSSGIGSATAGPMSHRRAADATVVVRSPGQLPSHYAPKTPLRLTDDGTIFSTLKDLTVGLLAWKTAPKNYAAVRILSETGDLREAAANLFRYLRELDSLNLDLIIAEKLPETGLGAAINDRLRRAQGTGTPPLT